MQTGRRSFLAVAASWIVAALAFLWPRRALSSPPRTSGPFTRPARPADPADPAPAAWSCDEPGYRESARTYRDLGLMLDDMHDHLCLTGHSVLAADDPERLRTGFATFDATPGAESEGLVWWQCSMFGARSLMRDLEAGRVPRSFGTRSGVDAAELLRQCFQTRDGKLRLAMAYEAGGRERFRAGLGPLPRG